MAVLSDGSAQWIMQAHRGAMNRTMLLSHVYLGISDFDRAYAFYSGVMRELGFVCKFYRPEKQWAGWMEDGVDRPLF